MIYIIQTNQSLNAFGEPKDFQSCIYKYESGVTKEYEWDYFKSMIQRGRKTSELKGTMKGITIGGRSPIETIINDDFHLEVLYKNNETMYTKSQYYLVPEEIFNKFKG